MFSIAFSVPSVKLIVAGIEKTSDAPSPYSIVIFDGKLSSLKRFTDDVKEVVAGYECGLTIEKYQDIKENDVLEVYEVVEEKRTLEDVAKDENEK